MIFDEIVTAGTRYRPLDYGQNSLGNADQLIIIRPMTVDVPASMLPELTQVFITSGGGAISVPPSTGAVALTVANSDIYFSSSGGSLFIAPDTSIPTPTGTFPFPELVHASSTKTVRHRTLIQQFGDGYSQRIPDGFNSRVESWSIEWIALPLSKYQTLTDALDAAGSVTPLLWTPPGETVQRKFVMTLDGYTVKKDGPWWHVSCNMQQVFDFS